MRSGLVFLLLSAAPSFGPLHAQDARVIDLNTALDLARKNSPSFQSAVLSAQIAHEDRRQAKDSLLPSLNYLNQYIHTQGDGLRPSGAFISNDGVHVYNSQGVVHEELSFAKRAGYLQTVAAESAAFAKQEIAARGLVATVTSSYYALVLADRKSANARKTLTEAEEFATLTSRQEQGGEVARADVVKAQLTVEQRRRDLQDAELAGEKARITLAILLFPDYTTPFRIVDDLDRPPDLATLPEVRALAARNNPTIRAAQATLRQEDYSVASARAEYLPTLSFDVFYGINANQFAIHAPDGARNPAYSAQGSLIIPLWNWGATQSRVRQAKLRREQARLDLTLTQRELLANLDAGYREAESAHLQLASLQHSLDLAVESLRLTLLRYQAGEATALEVTDAQSTLAQARNAHDDGLSRYRLALAALQTLTGI